MKKILIVMLAILVFIGLTACTAECVHTDTDKDGICDKCDTRISACEHEDTDTNDKCDKCGASLKNGDLVFVQNSKTEFSIVVANSLSDNAYDYVSYFSKKLNNFYLQDQGLKINYDAREPKDTIEMIVGTPSNRGQLFKRDVHYLGYEGFSIEVIGNKLFVIAGGDKGYQNAIQYVENTLFDLDSFGENFIESLVIPADTKYEQIQTEYDIEQLTVDGADIGDFVIAYTSQSYGATDAALILQDAIYRKSGAWIPCIDKNEASSSQSVIYVEDTRGDAARGTEDGAIVYVKDGNLHVECEFEYKFKDVIYSLIDRTLTSPTVDISSDFTFTKDVRNIYYSEFGAVGDGKTDDFFAIKACHEVANEYGHTVHADGPDKVYYIGNYLDNYDSPTSISIQTDTNWHGCTFIFDDREVKPNSPCFASPVFIIESSYDPITYSNLQVKSLTKGAADLGGWAPGVECLIYIENSNLRHYIRYGLNANNGSPQHEIIYVHADGTIDPSTPLQWDYEVITSLTVYPCDSKPITVTGGDGDERVTIKTIFNGAPSRYTYYQRNIKITRSNVTLQNVDHLVEGEVPESRGGTGAPYSGFTNVQYANNVTIQNMLIHNLVGYHLETNKSNGMGTYEISASNSNNVLWKNIKQDVFFDADGGVSYQGLMGTNYCKNLTFDGNFVCSFDAHCGVYNGTIRNSTIEHLNFIGDGLITIENTTLYVDGSKTAIQLRSDYGATWRGDVYMKDVDLKYETRKDKTVSLISSAWNNHSFGYTCYLPQNIHIENVRMLGFTVTVTGGERNETIVDINEKKIYLFTSGTVYNYTGVDISDPEAIMSSKRNDWVKCTCATRPDSDFVNPEAAKRGFNDTDGDGRCNNLIIGPSQQSVWCWGFEKTPDKTVNANPYIGTKSVTVVNKDPNNPLTVVWPLTPQFKDMDVTVDGELIIEDGEYVSY